MSGQSCATAVAPMRARFCGNYSMRRSMARPDNATRDEAQAMDLSTFLPSPFRRLRDPQTDLPRIAKDPLLTGLIEGAIRHVPTVHDLRLGDAREMSVVTDESVHLILTSPPYWTLKEYRHEQGQMGHIEEYDKFLSELDRVWQHCVRLLVPGGRL